MTVLDADAVVAYFRNEMAADAVADLLRSPSAASTRLPLATADPALAAMVRAEAISLHALPDGAGRLPT